MATTATAANVSGTSGNWIYFIADNQEIREAEKAPTIQEKWLLERASILAMRPGGDRLNPVAPMFPEFELRPLIRRLFQLAQRALDRATVDGDIPQVDINVRHPSITTLVNATIMFQEVFAHEDVERFEMAHIVVRAYHLITGILMTQAPHFCTEAILHAMFRWDFVVSEKLPPRESIRMWKSIFQVKQFTNVPSPNLVRITPQRNTGSSSISDTASVSSLSSSSSSSTSPNVSSAFPRNGDTTHYHHQHQQQQPVSFHDIRPSPLVI